MNALQNYRSQKSLNYSMKLGHTNKPLRTMGNYNNPVRKMGHYNGIGVGSKNNIYSELSK